MANLHNRWVFIFTIKKNLVPRPPSVLNIIIVAFLKMGPQTHSFFYYKAAQQLTFQRISAGN